MRRSAVVAKLLGAIVKRNSRTRANELVMRSLVRILESTPPTHIVNKDSLKLANFDERASINSLHRAREPRDRAKMLGSLPATFVAPEGGVSHESGNATV